MGVEYKNIDICLAPSLNTFHLSERGLKALFHGYLFFNPSQVITRRYEGGSKYTSQPPLEDTENSRLHQTY